MTTCNVCNTEINLNPTENTRGKIGFKIDDEYICLECKDVRDFFCDSPKIKKKPCNTRIETNEIKPKPKSESMFMCANCKKNFSGIICAVCGFKNPMYVRNKKKKNKKNKKKKM